MFFAIIGAQVNLTGGKLYVLFLTSIIVAVAISTKLVVRGLHAVIFLKNGSKAMRVGIDMISRGEVGLFVARMGVTSEALSSNIYTTVIIMVTVTTMITPIHLRKAYSKGQS